ncbi:MAG: esterase [Streptosporangiales bacterium]|nr:esterase [Streptosporangiales bacterium]
MAAPRPGSGPSCERPGTDHHIRIPDRGAPGGSRRVWIHRPPGPDTADRPVLYLLHGSTTDASMFERWELGRLLDREMCRTGVPFVFAAPDGQAFDGSDTEWGDAQDGRFRIETFLTTKLIDAVEGEDRRPAALRAIGGVSMGGYGAAALALRHPDLYPQAVSFAGYFKVDDPSGTFGNDPDAHAPDRLLDRPDVRHARFFLVEGTEDHTPLRSADPPGEILGEADRFARLLRERDMTVEVRHPPGGHVFATWRPTLPAAVDFLVDGWVPG